MSWPWNLGQGSLKVIENGTIRKLGYVYLYSPPTVTMALCCIVSEIKRDWSKIAIFIPLASLSKYCDTVWYEKTSGVATLRWKKFEDMFSHFDRIPACDRQTDRQTDISPLHSPRYAYASRGKNGETTRGNGWWNKLGHLKTGWYLSKWAISDFHSETSYWSTMVTTDETSTALPAAKSQ